MKRRSLFKGAAGYYFAIHLAILVLVSILVAMLLSSCAGTIQPVTVQASSPGYAGNATSGIVPGSFGQGGSSVTTEWVQDYNQDIADYGSDPFFKHHLVKNEGLKLEEDGGWFATDEAHFNYAMMTSWRRSATHQPKTLAQKAGLP